MWTRKEKLIYTNKHRKKVFELARKYSFPLFVQILAFFHDFDKLIMLYVGIPNNIVAKIHRFYSHHHVTNKIGWILLEETVLDWESARYTKPEKKENAWEFANRRYPHLVDKISSICEKYKIPKIKES